MVHLAWQIQPNRDLEQLYRTNVDRHQECAGRRQGRGVKQVVCASSVGAYSKSSKDRRTGRILARPGDGRARTTAGTRPSRKRCWTGSLQPSPALPWPGSGPGLIFQGDAGSEIGRYFLGPVIPRLLPGKLRIPLLPAPDNLVFQAVHADDVAEAYWRVVDQRASGAFNIAAEPVLDPQELGRILGAKRILPVPMGLLHRAAGLTWRLRLQPTDSGWVEMAAGAPVMDTGRARRILGLGAKDLGRRRSPRKCCEGMGTGKGVAPSPVLKPRSRT